MRRINVIHHEHKLGSNIGCALGQDALILRLFLVHGLQLTFCECLNSSQRSLCNMIVHEHTLMFIAVVDEHFVDKIGDKTAILRNTCRHNNVLF